MKYNPKSIANFFIALARDEGAPLDPMKLQKLVYYANGWYAGYRGEPLINEPVEAWPYGPVIPSLYHEFKRFGRNGITTYAQEYNGREFEAVPPPADPGIQGFLRNIWTKYSGFSGVALSDMTHASGGPWDQARNANPDMKGTDIPAAFIVDHFRAAIQKANAG